jgi:biotin transport system substrate-specific component
MTAYASLLAALTAVGALIAIPIGPVPIVLQNLFVYLSGLLLGSKWGVTGMTVYLLAGACGLPVFSGGKGGIGHLIGPTGGYLLGFLPAVYIIGWITERAEKKSIAGILAMICATAVIYLCGVTWLKLITGMTLAKTLAVGMLPFLIGDAVKIAVAAALAKALQPIMKTGKNHLK